MDYSNNRRHIIANPIGDGTRAGQGRTGQDRTGKDRGSREAEKVKVQGRRAGGWLAS